MTKRIFPLALFFAAALCVQQNSFAQTSTPPANAADLEMTYSNALSIRADNILEALALTDAAKSNDVRQLIIAQYRALRTRDKVIDSQLKAAGKPVNYANREAGLTTQSKTLHQEFLTKLAADLTPEQIEMVKDKMTYNKVKGTYDAYCLIVPDLTDADKTEILGKLKAAREEAIDGGSAPEKSAIFQNYKEQINDYLNHHGHDVAKDFSEWNDKHSTNNISATTIPAK
jgi:hypothetical protein